MIEAFSNIHLVSEAIRDAVAPVFLLTGIGSILAVMTNRLGRAIDRARYLHDLDHQGEGHRDDIKLSVKRIKWLRRAIAWATIAALSVCISIAAMFLGVELNLNMTHVVLISFISSMFSIIVGLLCFIREIMLASRELIAPPKHKTKNS